MAKDEEKKPDMYERAKKRLENKKKKKRHGKAVAVPNEEACFLIGQRPYHKNGKIFCRKPKKGSFKTCKDLRKELKGKVKGLYKMKKEELEKLATEEISTSVMFNGQKA